MKKLILSLACILLVIGFITGCKNTKKEKITFDENLIINHLTIDNVKLSELNSINDILTKIKGSKKAGVSVCYKNSDGCKYYSNDDFSNNKNDEDISTIDVIITIENSNLPATINYSLFYNDYKNDIENAPYFKLQFANADDAIKLEDKPIKNYTKDELDSKFKITKTAFNDTEYKYEFTDSKNSNITLSGYFGSSNITIFNYTERDRGIK